MGRGLVIQTCLDVSCILSLIYYMAASHNPNVYVNYLYQASGTWGFLRGLYIIFSVVSDEAHGSYYDSDTGGYRAFSDNEASRRNKK